MDHTSVIASMAVAGLLAACGGTSAPPTGAQNAVLTSVIIGPPSGGVGRVVAVGSTVQLTASPQDQSGNAIAATVTWSSSATSVATVDQSSGLVRGVAMGTATISVSATAGGVSVTAGAIFQVLPISRATRAPRAPLPSALPR